MNCNNSTTVSIKKIINGGYGLACLDNGKMVLVRHALPGESIKIRIIEKRKQLNYAKIIAIADPHPGRIIPPCPYYGSCGGCNLQHADYKTQCSIKQHILTDLLTRNQSPALKEMSSQVLPIISSPSDFGYRQRIRLKISNKGAVGFNRFHSHDIIPIKRCLLASKRINNCLKQLLKSSPFQNLTRITEEIEILHNPIDDTICLLFSLKRRSRPGNRSDARLLCHEVAGITRIFFYGQQFALEGPFGPDETTADNRLHMNIQGNPPITLSWEAGGFCQVNTEQNRNLVQLVLKHCKISASDRILDLYCGMGNFALPVAQQAAQVHGIESQGSAIRSARFNSVQNGLANISYEKSDVATACAALINRQEKFDTIICDPPRQGMPGLAPALRLLTDRRIVYISCDPATLCRDLADLCKEGFNLKSLQPIDMFPQTHHIETVALLEINI